MSRILSLAHAGHKGKPLQEAQTLKRGTRPDCTREGDDEEEKQQQSSGSAIARLYQHALDSVFSFLDLSDLNRVMCVSRSWSVCRSHAWRTALF